MQGSKVVRAGLAVGIAAAACLVASCGSDEIGNEDVVAGVVSGEDVATTMRSLGSVRVAAVDAAGGALAEGTYDQATDRARVDEHGAGGEHTVVTVGGQAWSSWPTSATAACTGWVPQPLGTGASDVLGVNDAEAWWLILDETSSTVARSSGEVEGEDAARYTATFDLARVLERATAETPAAVANLQALAARVRKLRPLEGEPTAIPIDLWVDPDGRLVRMVVTVVPTVEPGSSDADPVQLLDIGLSGFDEPVAIAAPDPSQVAAGEVSCP